MKVIEDKQTIWPFILASALVHLLLILLLPMLAKPLQFEEKPIEVFAVPDIKESATNPYQIADIPEPAVQQKPKNPNFLGMYDSAVPEQTIGTKRPQGKEDGPTNSKRKSIKESFAKREPAKIGKEKLFAFDKHLFDERKSKIEQSEGSYKSQGSLDDFYPDFKRGANTYLNVERYPGVEYFVRLKHAFKITWNPVPSLGDYFTRNRVSVGSVGVVLGVSVNRQGELSELFVFRSSGIAEYDREALRTIRASAPFPTPPEKFLATDGVLRMSWTFSVYL